MDYNKRLQELFQSTPSVGRATMAGTANYVLIGFQSTPSVGRATILQTCSVIVSSSFQSTPSVGRATPPCEAACALIIISIHALRGEGDSVRPCKP